MTDQPDPGDPIAIALFSELFMADQLARALHRGLLIKRQSRIYLGGNPAGNQLNDVLTNGDREPVNAVRQHGITGTALVGGLLARYLCRPI